MATETKEKKVAPKKKVIAKKAVSVSNAKKQVAKKAPVKKAAAKAPAKKVTAKKPTVKKAPIKKPVVKKVATKKPAVKKAPAKKPVPKKPVAKKILKEKVINDNPIVKAEKKEPSKAKANKKQEDKEKLKANTKVKEEKKTKSKKTKSKKDKKEKVVYKLKSIEKPVNKKVKVSKSHKADFIKKRRQVEKQVSEKRDKKLIKSLKKLSVLQARLDEIKNDPIMEIRKRHKKDKLLETRIELIKRRNAEKHAFKDSEKALKKTTKKSMDVFMQRGSNSMVKQRLLKKSEFELRSLVKAFQHSVATETAHKNRDEKQVSLALSAFSNAEKAKKEQAKMLENKRKIVEAEKIKEDKRKAKIMKRIAKRKAKVDAKDAKDKKSFDKQVAIAKKELKRQMELEFAEKSKTDSKWKEKEIEDLKLQISQVNNANIESAAEEFENEINVQEEKIIDLNNKIDSFDTNNEESIKEKEALYEELEKTKEIVIKLNKEFKIKIADAVSEASTAARREVEKIKSELSSKAENDSRLQESIIDEDERRRSDEARMLREADKEKAIEESKRLKKIEEDTLVEEERLTLLSREREKNASDEIDRFNRIKENLQAKREKVQADLETETQIANDELEEAKRNARAKHEEAFGKLEDLAVENKDKELDSTKQIDIFKSKINKDW